ncbi:MAG: NTP transferase domain-containing protein [Anaerolineae bacterium]|nr:NTP transferase domain-containing protein [Anaerolineae bacterium]
MRAIIMAGGKGTRLAPYTNVLPKPLIPFGDYPILEIIICQLREHGFTDITLAVSYLAHLFEAYFGDGRRLGVSINYSLEDHPLGTAGPLTLLPDSDTPILVMNADLLTDIDYVDLYRYHCHEEAALTIALCPKEVHLDLGVINLSSSSEVVCYTEKPSFSYLVSMGIYVFSPHVIQRMPKNCRVDVPEVVTMLLEQKEKVSGYVFYGDWVDVGRLEDYAKAVERYQYLALAAERTAEAGLFGAAPVQIESIETRGKR